jgi:hypothetical protein
MKHQTKQKEEKDEEDLVFYLINMKKIKIFLA